MRTAVAALLNSARSVDELAGQFADQACLCYSEDESVDRRNDAAGLLAATPALTAASIYAAAAAFDTAALSRHLASDPAAANRSGGPRRWPPLMYLGYSRIAEAQPARDAVKAAGLLLQHGADPRFFVDGSAGWGGWRWTALTGVIGQGEAGPINQPPHPRARELATLLLEAGADPNDSQALYNSHFSADDEWLRLLLAHGLTADAPADPDKPGSEKTLDFLLGQAVGAGHADRVALLLEHGADAAGRDKRYTHRTHIQNAVLAGHQKVVELLVAHGAPAPKLSAADQFRMAIVAADADSAHQMLAEDARLIRQPALLVSVAQSNRLEAARLLLDAGADPNAMATNGRGALHEAAWSGHREMIELLLSYGARLDVRSKAHGGTAVGYAHHAGRTELRDWLLDRSDDVFDLVAYGRPRQLAAMLEQDPALLQKRDNEGATLLAVARNSNKPDIVDVVNRFAG